MTPLSPFRRYSAKLTQHTAIYSLTAVATLVFGLINVAFVTRFLTPSQYGRASLYLFFASLLTTLYSIGTLQGTSGRVFGSTDDVDSGTGDEITGSGLSDKRRALATGLAIMCVVAVAGTVIISFFSPSVAQLVIGHHAGQAGTLMWAAAAGALGAVWRLASNILRMERRPGAYVVVHSFRPACILIGQASFLYAGYGLRGAVEGVVFGDAAALVIAVLAILGSMRFALSLKDAAGIARYGLPIAPLMVSFWLIQNADLYFLSRYASFREVGLYRVANAVAAMMAYAVGAFSMAWGPLRRAPVFLASEADIGRSEGDAILTTYFVLATLLILVFMWDAGGWLIQLAPHSYSGAAPLIPLIALQYAAHGWYVLIYRTSEFHAKRMIFVGLTTASTLVFAGASLVLIPAWGSYGAALAPLIAFLVASVALYLIALRSAPPVPYQWGRIGGAVVIAAAVGYIGNRATLLHAPYSWLGAITAMAVVPALFLVTGIVPREHVRPLFSVLLAAVSPQRKRKQELIASLAQLQVDDRALLRDAIRDRVPATRIAERRGTGLGAVYSELVRALREICGLPPVNTQNDEAVGALLLYRGPVAEWDQRARLLWPMGADPREVDLFQETCNGLRRLSRRRWQDLFDPPQGGVRGHRSPVRDAKAPNLNRS